MSIKDFTLNKTIQSNGQKWAYHFAWLGVPHAVFFGHNIMEEEDASFSTWAKQIRYNAVAFPDGTNVNMVEPINKNNIKIRTYERGVEEETFACGSGATTSSIVASLLGKVGSPVHVHTRGGILTIKFQVINDNVQGIS